MTKTSCQVCQLLCHDYFAPIQLGVGVSGGSESAIHATRRFIESMPNEFVIAKLNFTNAFNNLRRGAIC